MGLAETLKLAHHALDRVDVGHALIGGLAMGALGVPRATADVDLLVDGEKRAEARTALLEAGFTLLCESDEVIQLAGVGALDCLLARRPPTRAMLETAWVVPGIGVKCVHAEDLIGLKIQAYVNDPRRELQDKADIQAIVRRHLDLDWPRVQAYAELFGQWPAIEAIRAAG